MVKAGDDHRIPDVVAEIEPHEDVDEVLQRRRTRPERRRIGEQLVGILEAAEQRPAERQQDRRREQRIEEIGRLGRGERTAHAAAPGENRFAHDALLRGCRMAR